MTERRQRSVDHIEEKVDAVQKELSEHITREEVLLARLLEAFPEGPEAHRTTHEAMIKAAKAQEVFWSELRLDMAKNGVRAVVLVVIGLVLAGLSAKLLTLVHAAVSIATHK